MNEVEYRDIHGYPGYRVGDDGSVWSRWTKSSKPKMGEWKQLGLCNAKGYSSVGLSRFEGVVRVCRMYYVHHLVLNAFVGPCPPGMEACHDPDRSPKNNSRTNLRWDTRKGNAADMVKHGQSTKGSKCAQAKLTEPKVEAILVRLVAGETQRSIANDEGVDPSTISHINRGHTWTHVKAGV